MSDKTGNAERVKAPPALAVKDNSMSARKLETPRDVLGAQTTNKFQGKIAFFIGVINVQLTIYLFGGHPKALMYYFMGKLPILILLRFITYYKEKYHYFLLDFCYFSAFALWSFCWELPSKDQYWIFMCLFGVINGPIGWAVVTFRNSLVFHSVDKMTSLLIHVTPVLVSHVIRFHLQDDFQICDPDIDLADDPCDSVGEQFKYIVGGGMAFFVSHSILYFLVVQIGCMKFNPAFANTDEDENGESQIYWTSFRWLTKKRGSLGNRLVFSCGPRMAPLMYGLLQFLFGLITILPTVVFYNYEWVHFGFLLVVSSISVWNGANFYYEVFSCGRGQEVF